MLLIIIVLFFFQLQKNGLLEDASSPPFLNLLFYLSIIENEGDGIP